MIRYPSLRLPLLLAVALPAAATAQTPRPKLVVMITVDQLRPDYFDRYKAQLTGGLARLVAGGAVFTDAYQDHAITETAVGHATILAGRWPAHHGIINNALGVGDSTFPLVEGRGAGASPYRFRGTVLMDWLKVADSRSRALSVSIKDRAAILPMGRTREQVYWYARGLFTTSTYYAAALPDWVKAFNARGVPAQSVGRTWDLLLPPDKYPEPDGELWENGGRDLVFPHRLPTDTAAALGSLPGTPFADDLVLAFALEGVQTLGLGRGTAPDLLNISLSATDYIGHGFGPNSREIHDQVLRLDRTLGAFLDSLYRLRDSNSVIIALSADHGVTPIVEYTTTVEKQRAARVSLDTFARAMDSALVWHLGPSGRGRYVDFADGVVFIQRRAMEARGVKVDSLVDAWLRETRRNPWVQRTDTRRTLATADTAKDAIARRWRHELPPDVPAEVLITLKPGSVWAAPVPAMHGSPQDADAHVPLIIKGPGVRAGTYRQRVNTVDLAPTLAELLQVSPLEALDGRVLTEALGVR